MSPTLPLLPFAILSLAINHAFASPLPQNGDGGGTGALPDGGLGYDPSAAGDANPGSAGNDTGGVGLSKGAIIAIAVVAGIVSIFGVTAAVLFWGAKKRQWAVAETMRRSMRRVTTGLKALTPRTPHRMTFSPIEKRRAGSFGNGLLHKNQHNPAKPTDRFQRTDTGGSGRRDAEKAGAAVPTYTTTVTGGAGSRSGSADNVPTMKPQQQQGPKKQHPTPPSLQMPHSKFEMDSPKTPMWNRVFGR